MADAPNDGFLSRWARRKEQARDGAALAPEPEVAPLPVPGAATAPAPLPGEPPPPTMADVALLTRDSDYARFVGAGVDAGVQRAALKKLFSDPHFNAMDGLDTYIADYGQPDPIPIAMLRQMNQSKMLRLFDTEDDAADPERVAAATDPPSAPDDDPDLRLQQDDAAGRPGPGQGPGA